MEKANIESAPGTGLVLARQPERAPIVSFHELLATGFRHKRSLSTCFVGVMAIAVLAAIVIPPKYESQAKLLVKHERVDPVLTPGSEQVQARSEETTAEELNSEVELILSEDLLDKVAAECGLIPSANHQLGERATALAVENLRSHLKVEVVHKTNVIMVSYTARDPEVATRVVNAVVSAYLEKHVAVHNSSQLGFFDQQVAKYHDDLSKAEAALNEFSQSKNGAVSPELERDALLQKQSEFNATLQQTRSQVRETVARIATLEAEASDAPERVTTQVRKLDNPQLMQDLKATLLKLELRRTDLLSKYQASYPPVQELDQEIARTQAAISAAEKSPLSDQTSDVNPIRQWIDSELTKDRADLQSLQSKADNLAHISGDYERQARAMDEQQMRYTDLQRNAKSAEENYMLYVRKREEARITNALDQSRILNVTVIQPATRPVLPNMSRTYFLGLGLFFAFVATAVLLFAVDHMDNTFRTPHQIERVIQIPVLATVPVVNFQVPRIE